MGRVRDPDGKRRAVLDAAVEELARKGYHGANTAVIAKKAGVSVGTVFNLFSTKEQLANAVLQDCRLKYEALLPQGFDDGSPPREQFARLYRAVVAMHSRHPHHFVFYENHLHGEFIDAPSRLVRDGLRDKLRAWIESMQQRGAFAEGAAETLRAIVFGGLTRLVRESLDGNLRLTKTLLDSLEELSWRAISRPAGRHDRDEGGD